MVLFRWEWEGWIGGRGGVVGLRGMEGRRMEGRKKDRLRREGGGRMIEGEMEPLLRIPE